MSNPVPWSTIKSVIQTQVAHLADLSTAAVRWVDEPSGLINGTPPVVWLRISSVVAVGIEQERLEDPSPFDPTQPQKVNVCGPREFTLSIRCESITPDISDERAAANICEKLETRFLRTTARETRSGTFSIGTSRGTKFYSYIEAGRPVSVYTLDILCTTAANDVDSDSDGSFIQEALVHGDLKDTSGDTIQSVDVDANAR